MGYMYPPGTIIGGKYRVDRVIGEGGMGIVVSATHLGLDQQVAIKLLQPGVLGNPEVTERLLREAKASARLRSEHVARVVDVAQHEDGTPYIVLELLIGEDLGTTLQQGPLHPPTAVAYILQAAEALAEAHAARIIHRDIKLQNLYLTTDPGDGTALIKVLDFGISKTEQGGAVSSLTATSTVMGTPAYMSPEQLRSARAVDQRGDIWALGVCLYELVSGRRPFDGEVFSEVCMKIAVDEAPPLSSPHRYDLTALEAVVRRCLQKDPAARFQTVVEMAYALAPFAGDAGWASYQRCARLAGGTHQTNPRQQVVAPVVGGGTPTTMRRAAGQVGTGPVPLAGRSKKKWLVGIGAVSVLAILIAVAAGTSGKAPAPAGAGAGAAGPAEVPAKQPAATAPEVKPAQVTKPPVVETKPPAVETKPAVVETKPADSKPAVVEAKPAESKPAVVVVETKPADSKPAQQVTPPPGTPASSKPHHRKKPSESELFNSRE